MDTSTNNELEQQPMREVRIISGLTPEDVEVILEMAASSGLFSSDALMSAEDMAWDSAYGSGSGDHTFLQAKVSESGVDRSIGFICFGPIPNWFSNYEMYGIAISPEFQRMGIGTALVSEMKRQVTTAKGKRIFLETGEERAYENARLFYEENDFVQEHRFFKQFIPNQGGVVYRFSIETDDAEQFQ